MTDHPLTDEICEKTRRFGARSYLTMTQFSLDERAHMMELDVNYNMRAAADWQLEQVIKWINEAIFEQSTCFGIESLPEELAKAMRLTNTQKNN